MPNWRVRVTNNYKHLFTLYLPGITALRYYLWKFCYSIPLNCRNMCLSYTGGLIFSDKFLQVVTKLPSDVMYGWGENVHPTLKVRGA